MKDWNTIYETAGIGELKTLGHKLLDEYIALDEKREGRNAVEHAYKKLGTKLNSMYGMHHFGKMKSRKEIVNAIVKLRRMIESRNRKLLYEKEVRDAAVYLPSAEMKAALSKLKYETNKTT